MKKIAVLYLGRTGVGPIYTLEMVRALSSQARVLVVLSCYIDNKKDWEIEAGRNKNMEVQYIKTYNSSIGFLLSFTKVWKFWKIVHLINQYTPDMVYSTWVHYWDVMIYPFLKCRMKVKTIHDVEIKKGEDGLRWRYLHFFSFKYADKYIILSRKYIKNLTDRGINKNDIVVIPHACFSYYRDEDPNSSDFIFHNKILFFGRIVAYKGLNILLDAMKLVIKALPDIRLVIVGDGDIALYKRRLDELQNNIEIHNFWISNDDVKKYFNEIDILVVPYIDATQSGVVPLSYSFAKPVIVSDVGALSEQVYEGETGFVIEPGNPVVLAEAIKKIMTNKELLYSMGKKCDAVYRNELTWDVSAQKILELF